jgi:DNA-binding beta-propeller fold protein YncE
MRPVRPAILLLFLPLLLFTLVFAWQVTTSHPAQAFVGGGTPGYLPITSFDPTNTPIPTPTTSPIPEVLAIVSLPDALCPHDVAVNPLSGYAYVANPGNATTSIISGTNHINTQVVGHWPNRFAVDPNSTRAFLTIVVEAQISMFDYDTLYINLPTFGEAADVVYNPVNNFIYVVDLSSHITVYDGITFDFVADIDLAGGVLLDVAVDPNTGRVYAAGWESGNVFEIEGTALVRTVQAGWGVQELAIDPNSGHVYAAHSAPNEEYPHNISVMKDGALLATYITGARSMDVAVNPVTGLAYFVNPDEDTVTVLNGPNMVGGVGVGDDPWSVAVNPTTNRVYIANRGENTVTVLNETMPLTTLTSGLEPISVDVDPVRGLAYVANHASHVECNEFGQCDRVCDPYASVTVIK